MADLTPKQDRFCREYLTDFNATQAAIRSGYSKKGAQQQGSYLLLNPVIQEHIKKLRAKVEDKLELTAERVLYEIKCLAYCNPLDYYEKNKKGVMVLKDPFTLTDAQQRAIRNIEVVKGKVVSLELYNKDPSLDKLGKNLKLFTELNETVHSFTMMGQVTLKAEKGEKGKPVKVQSLTFNVGQPIERK